MTIVNQNCGSLQDKGRCYFVPTTSRIQVIPKDKKLCNSGEKLLNHIRDILSYWGSKLSICNLPRGGDEAIDGSRIFSKITAIAISNEDKMQLRALRIMLGETKQRICLLEKSLPNKTVEISEDIKIQQENEDPEYDEFCILDNDNAQLNDNTQLYEEPDNESIRSEIQELYKQKLDCEEKIASIIANIDLLDNEVYLFESKKED